MTTPDKWLILKVNDHYRVFGTWSGGYLDGDSWRMNSGITKVEEDDEHYLFTGSSGSVYKCRKTAYGSTGYGYSVIDTYTKQAEETNIPFEMLSEDFNFMELTDEL